jgi:hypothetical protein
MTPMVQDLETLSTTAEILTVTHLSCRLLKDGKLDTGNNM